MYSRNVRWKVAAVGAAAVVALGLVPGAASADTATRTDRRGDAPKSIDIVRATYRHSPSKVSTTIKVPGLDGPARASLAISKFTIFEAGYVAIVKKKASGKVSKRLYYFNHFKLIPRKCKVTGSWNERVSTVRIAVPRKCLKHHKTDRLYVAARTIRREKFDDARPVRRLQRG